MASVSSISLEGHRFAHGDIPGSVYRAGDVIIKRVRLEAGQWDRMGVAYARIAVGVCPITADVRDLIDTRGFVGLNGARAKKYLSERERVGRPPHGGGRRIYLRDIKVAHGRYGGGESKT